MAPKAPNYFELEKHLTQATHLNYILSLAKWDAATMLAPKSASSRQQEIATGAMILQKMCTTPELGQLIEAAQNEMSVLNEWQQANLKLAKKAHEEAQCITPEMQEEYTKASGECEFVWRTARKNNDFKQLVPYLDRVFDIVRKIANQKASHFNKKPYDVLIDSYSPDFTTTSIQNVYAVLKEALPGLIQTIVAKQAQEKVLPFTEKLDKDTQKSIGLKVIESMGFSLAHGRLDESAHPFCNGSNDDVRLTTRYHEENLLAGLMGTIHEAGHGLYHQNLPHTYRDQPVGDSLGMAFHESQSLIMERQACTSPAFMEYLAKLLRDELGLQGEAYKAKNLYQLLSRVNPSFIRIEADEVTYPLHVILRFEIEQGIVDGTINAKDLPALWNAKMKDYLGITPKTDAVGCMQDIHWPSGKLGYFPSYTLGAIIASMLMKAAKAKYPSIEAEISQGKFVSLNTYLNEHLRQFGSLKTSTDLLTEATGYTEVQPGIFINYLKAKYL